jgi:uncharacterized membrane protein YjgN (DUF898 family)
MDTDAPAGTAPERHPIGFTASGSEYFRIWIVNLLLIIVTLGLYLPWARVRKFKYFYANTWVGGDALGFHGEPVKMLRGTLIAAAFLIAYSVGSNFSGWAALLAALAFVALWPALFRAAMRFRLANTSWRGLRFRFAGDMAGAYAAMMPPLALALLPVAMAGLIAGAPLEDGKPGAPSAAAAGLIGLGMVAFFAGLPFFLWKLRRYQHDHFVFGGLQTRLSADVGVIYGIFIKLIGLSIAAVVVVVVAAGLFTALGVIARKGTGPGVGVIALLAILAIGGVLLLNVLPKSYLQVRLQNLLWSATGNEVLRFDSRLKLGGYIGLQLKNYLLIFITLGFYWPFAVVHTRRAQLEAVTLETHIPLDEITRVAGDEDPGAAGDMAADLFGLDIGM